jgi:pimeloyl-ACP methyl ester carboxylesterase
MAEEKNNINGLEINYKIAGQGPAILVLHGWGGSSDSWIETQKILSKEYKVIVPDLPGFGKSAPPQRPWKVGDYVDFVSKFSEKLNLEDFFLIGHSFGGRISIKFSIQHPEKVKKLILCDSAGIKPDPSLKTIIIFWLVRIGNAIFTPKIFKRFQDSARNLFYIFLRNRDYAKANGVMKETIKKVLAEDLLLEVPKIKAETLIIWGEADRMVPLKYARMFKEKIENSRLEVLPKIGHSPHLEVPKNFSEIVLKFIKEKS